MVLGGEGGALPLMALPIKCLPEVQWVQANNGCPGCMY